MKKTLIFIMLLTALYSCEKTEELKRYENQEFYIRVENTFHNFGLSFDWSFREYSGTYTTREYYEELYCLLSSGDSITIRAHSNSRSNITITIQDIRRDIIFEKTDKINCELKVIIP